MEPIVLEEDAYSEEASEGRDDVCTYVCTPAPIYSLLIPLNIDPNVKVNKPNSKFSVSFCRAYCCCS